LNEHALVGSWQVVAQRPVDERSWLWLIDTQWMAKNPGPCCRWHKRITSVVTVSCPIGRFSIERAVGVIHSIPIEVRAAVSGTAKGPWREHPDAGAWSVAKYLCHLLVTCTPRTPSGCTDPEPSLDRCWSQCSMTCVPAASGATTVTCSPSWVNSRRPKPDSVRRPTVLNRPIGTEWSQDFPKKSGPQGGSSDRPCTRVSTTLATSAGPARSRGTLGDQSGRRLCRLWERQSLRFPLNTQQRAPAISGARDRGCNMG